MLTCRPDPLSLPTAVVDGMAQGCILQFPVLMKMTSSPRRVLRKPRVIPKPWLLNPSLLTVFSADDHVSIRRYREKEWERVFEVREVHILRMDEIVWGGGVDGEGVQGCEHGGSARVVRQEKV